MTVCARCYRNGTRHFKASRDGTETVCSNELACHGRMVDLSWKNPARLLSDRIVLGFEADRRSYEADDEAVLLFLDHGITVVIGTEYFAPEQAHTTWRIDFAHERHPEHARGED